MWLPDRDWASVAPLTRSLVIFTPEEALARTGVVVQKIPPWSRDFSLMFAAQFRNTSHSLWKSSKEERNDEPACVCVSGLIYTHDRDGCVCLEEWHCQIYQFVLHLSLLHCCPKSVVLLRHLFCKRTVLWLQRWRGRLDPRFQKTHTIACLYLSNYPGSCRYLPASLRKTAALVFIMWIQTDHNDAAQQCPTGGAVFLDLQSQNATLKISPRLLLQLSRVFFFCGVFVAQLGSYVFFVQKIHILGHDCS